VFKTNLELIFNMNIEDIKIGVLGLGYVGLPLAVAFSKIYPVLGYDINTKRVQELKTYYDHTGEVDSGELERLDKLTFCSDISDFSLCNFYILTVPTPVNSDNKPDLSSLISATQSISGVVSSGNFVVYESTVYPGVTEETCIPILESISGLVLNKSLFCGYSPERINPGDQGNSIENIMKITSGSNDYAASVIDRLYSSIITAGTYLAPSIRVAEAAKVIENTQRDVNIALMNELAVICDHLGINTTDVIDAASTKWNFHSYSPGLVGGHCIGVDPYYLAYRSELEGYIPDIILGARKINNDMAKYVADRLVKNLVQKNVRINKSKILILGFTFKENCSDTRNTKVRDLTEELEALNCNVKIFDPYVASASAAASGVTVIDEVQANTYDAIIIAVPHRKFLDWGIDKIRSFGKSDCFVFDLKSAFPADFVDAQL
jgi:UDP-N-acetyl-D-glucosamine/UDP-N-acetyl-D-galactosamine dehydrogenase